MSGAVLHTSLDIREMLWVWIWLVFGHVTDACGENASRYLHGYRDAGRLAERRCATAAPSFIFRCLTSRKCDGYYWKTNVPAFSGTSVCVVGKKKKALSENDPVGLDWDRWQRLFND